MFSVDDYIVAGPLTIDTKSRRAITTQGMELSLSPKEFDTLAMLVANEGQAYSLADIENLGNDNGVAVMSYLKAELENTGAGFMSIKEHANGTYSFETLWSNKYVQNSNSELGFSATLV